MRSPQNNCQDIVKSAKKSINRPDPKTQNSLLREGTGKRKTFLRKETT